jgi:hypothetical protein
MAHGEPTLIGLLAGAGAGLVTAVVALFKMLLSSKDSQIEGLRKDLAESEEQRVANEKLLRDEMRGRAEDARIFLAALERKRSPNSDPPLPR